MEKNNGEKDRVEQVVKDLLDRGWSKVMVGTTIVYQKPTPIQKLDQSVNKK